jgi:hypothetical protein
MKSSLMFAVISFGLTLVAALVLGVAFDAPGERRAVWLSAGVAYGVQLLAFAIARLLRRDNVMLGWGMGVLVRLVALVAFALVFVNALGLPPSAALISLVIYFFVTTLVEPLFLAS